MAKYNTRYEQRSRLAKIESKRLAKQTYLLIIGTIGLLILMIVVGIPLLMKMAIFLGEVRSGQSLTTNSDTIAPPSPQLAIPYQATQSATISLNGYAEAGANVLLYQDNVKTVETIATAGGSFSFDNVSLNSGINTFYVIAKDQAGNTSQASSTFRIDFDTKPPTITIDEPEDGKDFFGLTERLVTIKGQTEEGARLTMNDRVVVVRSDGSFSSQYQLEEGDNVLLFNAIDKAGNSSKTELNLHFTP